MDTHTHDRVLKLDHRAVDSNKKHSQGPQAPYDFKIDKLPSLLSVVHFFLPYLNFLREAAALNPHRAWGTL